MAVVPWLSLQPARPLKRTSLFSLFKEEPRKVCFTYDLFLNLEGNPPVNHLRCEKLTFNNPTVEFRYKLLLAGGVSAPLGQAPPLLTGRSVEAPWASCAGRPGAVSGTSLQRVVGRLGPGLAGCTGSSRQHWVGPRCPESVLGRCQR